MCGLMEVVTGALLGSSLFGSKASAPQVQAPVIQQYTPDDSDTPSVTAPPAPVATPVMGQQGASDLQKDASNDILKKNKKGRAALRIDRDPKLPAAVGTGGQAVSGTVVPRG